MNKEYRYRFKTRKEFEEEFGKNWRDKLGATWVDSMDCLFLKVLFPKYNDYADKMKLFMITLKGNQCIISRDMLKRIDLTIDYPDIKLVLTKTPFHANPNPIRRNFSRRMRRKRLVLDQMN